MQLTAAMVGMLGGPALQVLTILAIEGGPRALSFIMDMANLSDKTASQAVRKLKTLGMITENARYVYQIAGNVAQLPLMAQELPAEAESEIEQAEEEPEGNPMGFSPEIRSENFRPALNESMNESESINQDDSFIDSCGDSSEKFRAASDVTAAELREIGFYGRGLKDLLAIRGLTRREVQYHVNTAPSLGAALTRIRKRQPVPADFERDVGGNDRNRYISGEFAAWIVH